MTEANPESMLATCPPPPSHLHPLATVRYPRLRTQALLGTQGTNCRPPWARLPASDFASPPPLPMSIADVPSRGWFALVPRLSRDSLPVDWYTALRCPLPAQVPDLRVPVTLWWQLTASQPHCSLVILHRTHQLQGPGQTGCAFTFAHTACSFRVHPTTPQHTHTHTHTRATVEMAYA